MSDPPEFHAALARHRAGDLAEAVRLYEAVVAGREHYSSLHNLAMILKTSGRFDEAEPLLRRAVEVAPDKAGAWFALGRHLRLARRLEAAVAAFREVLALEPARADAGQELGIALLALGRLEAAWDFHEARPNRLRILAQGLSVPEWRGQPLAGRRLFVAREQGFGDQIMMARFLPGLGAAEVTYSGHPALARLFAPLGVTYLAAPTEEQVSLDGQDYWVLAASLPAVLGATLKTLPTAPYLSGTPRPAGGRIGFVWRGEPSNPNAPNRDMAEPAARRLLAAPGVVSLDPAQTGAADFQDTADLIAGLGLVISVDTSVAHLAAAMGRPTWVLAGAHGLDWPWMAERTDSPWYPSARVIRQRRAGDWDAVVDDVLEALGREELTG
jgi:hypothetical protein